MCKGERPGASKGKQPNSEASCQTPPSSTLSNHLLRQVAAAEVGFDEFWIPAQHDAYHNARAHTHTHTHTHTPLMIGRE